MSRKQHSYDEMAEDVAKWIEDTAQAIAAGMYEGDAAPGAATLTRGEQLDYYRRLLYLPDGMPNPEGRARFQQALGPKERARVLDALIRRRTEKEAPVG